MALILPSEPPDTPSARRFALWNLGFRPFYLLAGALAAISIAVWVAQYQGWLGNSLALAGPLWHAHEMIFGYAFAVITGFLFTAAQNWTNRPTPSGGLLAAIAALWIAARVLVLTPYAMLAAAADTAFALAAAAGIAVPMWKSRNRRNYFFVALLLALGAVNLCFHLTLADVIDLPLQRGVQIALDLILFIMAVMGGRVIPMFTANAVRGATGKRVLWLERLALGSVLALIIADLPELPPVVIGVIASIAAIAHGARLALWQPWLTLSRPILWILHASYGWIVVSLALRALAEFGMVPGNLATHALTVGAIGGLTLGMMTRTARGHTGRPLEAAPLETICYQLMQLAAVARVLVPLAIPGLYVAAVVASGLLWSVAFATFTVMYWPILTRPRIDGRPG